MMTSRDILQRAIDAGCEVVGEFTIQNRRESDLPRFLEELRVFEEESRETVIFIGDK